MPTELNIEIEKLEKLIDDFLAITNNIFKPGQGKLHILDLLAIAVSNRGLNLIRGFILLAKNNNYQCAAPLIRLQLDNSLRLFASTLVGNHSDFIDHVLSGKKISAFRDIDGKKLYDNYLVEKLELLFGGIKSIYEQTSGYIHLSDSHIYNTLKNADKKERKLKFVIGSSDFFDSNKKLEFIRTMNDVSLITLKILDDWCEYKNNIYGK